MNYSLSHPQSLIIRIRRERLSNLWIVRTFDSEFFSCYEAFNILWWWWWLACFYSSLNPRGAIIQSDERKQETTWRSEIRKSVCWLKVLNFSRLLSSRVQTKMMMPYSLMIPVSFLLWRKKLNYIFASLQEIFSLLNHADTFNDEEEDDEDEEEEDVMQRWRDKDFQRNCLGRNSIHLHLIISFILTYQISSRWNIQFSCDSLPVIKCFIIASVILITPTPENSILTLKSLIGPIERHMMT